MSFCFVLSCAGYSTVLKKKDAENFGPDVCPLKTFLEFLEDEKNVDLANLTVACHKITPTSDKDAAGDILGRSYKIEHTEHCTVHARNETEIRITIALSSGNLLACLLTYFTDKATQAW